MFKTQYRVVRDSYSGFEVQHRRWFWPFWFQTNYCNTHHSLEDAERFAKARAHQVVKMLGSFSGER